MDEGWGLSFGDLELGAISGDEEFEDFDLIGVVRKDFIFLVEK